MKKNKDLCQVGEAYTVDTETGEQVPIEGGGLRMLPPAPGKCQDCAVAHEPYQHHDQQSLYYQMKFYAIHKRWPTWTDAMAHCSAEYKRTCRAVLLEKMVAHGLEIPEDLKHG